MARFVTGKTFGTTETVTAALLNQAVNDAAISTDSVDNSTIEVNSNALRIKDNGVTLAKMATQADQTVLGNVSGGTAVPTAVPIVGAAGILVNNDSLGTDDTKGATQGNIKAYVDTTAGPTVGFNPTSYTGGETTTLPNGLTIKFGSITSGIPSFGVEGTITFANAFDTACLYANIITNNYNGVGNANNTIESVSVSNIKYKHGMNPAVTKIYWQAIGH